MDKKRVVSFILSLLMLLGTLANPVFAISSNPNREEDAKHEIQEIDGKTYKVYKVSDLGLKNPEKLLTPKYRSRAAGDPMEDWVKLRLQSNTVGLTLGNDFNVEVYVALRKDSTKIAVAKINPTKEIVENEYFYFVKTDKFDENNPDHQDPDKWYLYVEDDFKYDIRFGYGESGNFGSESMTMTIQQRAVPLYKAVWFTNNQQRPVVDAIYNDGDNRANTVKLNTTDFAENEYKSFSSEKMPFYVDQKEVIVKEENLGTVDKEKFLVSDMKGAVLWKLLIDQNGEKKTQGFVEDGDTKYHFNITGDYKTPFVATMREELKVKFDPNGATFDPAVKTEQAIGHSMKIGEAFGDLEAVKVPTKDQISNIPQKDNKDQKFVGWVIDEANKSLDFSDGKNKDKLVDPNGYEVKKNVTFYAVYAPEAQGRVAVQYVDVEGNAINDKYKIKDEKYPDRAEGNKGKPVEASKIKEPKFIGYKRTADTIADAIKNKTYETENIQTVEVKYEKLPNIIPEKDGNGNDNPKVTEDVKKHYAKVIYQVDPADDAKAELQLDGAKAKSPLVYYVNPVEEIAIKDVAKVTAVSKDKNLYKVDANDMWKFDPDSIENTDQKIFQARDKKDNVVDTVITLTAKVADTDAQKYKNQLVAQDIVKWVKDPVEWKDGVKTIDGVTFKSVEDLGNRDTSAAGKFTGKLEVTFQDDSKATVDNQNLFVRAKKADKVTPNTDDPGNYPKDKVEVTFAKSTGIEALDPENKVIAMKSGEKLVAEDYPEVTVKANFKKKTNKTDYYDVEPGVITGNKTITASTTEIGNGTAVVKFVDTANTSLDPKNDVKLQIANENYAQTLSGKDGVKITYDKSKAPKILGYKLTEKAPVISSENFKEGQEATITLEYEKLKDIIPGTGNTQPDGYVTVKFTAQDGAELSGETTYFVNPKAGKTLNDITEPTVKSKDATKYEVKTGDDLWKPVLNKADEITENKTFEAQVFTLGKPVVDYPDVNVGKGKTGNSTPTIKDKKGNPQTPTEEPKILDENDQPIKPGEDKKIVIGDSDKGIKITPKEDGKIVVEVPEDYNGPNTVTVKVRVNIPGQTDPITDTFKIIVKEDKPVEPKPEEPRPSAPAITWRGLWFLGDSKSEPVQEMETGRHYKYLYGYVDKTVRPEGMITRSEAAALIARLANLDMSDKTKPDFKDTPSAWYNSAINAMVSRNLMFADKNGNFRPNEPITRGEFARALYYIDKKNDKVAPFADVKGHEFEEAINQAYGNGRIAGYQDGTFKPNANIQRAEAARILNQYADRNVTLAGMANVKRDLVRFTDINESHWAYCEVMEAANSHEYQRAKGTLAETWLKILDK